MCNLRSSCHVALGLHRNIEISDCTLVFKLVYDRSYIAASLSLCEADSLMSWLFTLLSLSFNNGIKFGIKQHYQHCGITHININIAQC